jgi:hypothetical protein
MQCAWIRMDMPGFSCDNFFKCHSESSLFWSTLSFVCSLHCRGCVTPETVAWVKRTAPQLPRVPASAAFIHIPLPEFVHAWNRGTNVAGTKGELICCPSCNSEVFSALRCSAHPHLWASSKLDTLCLLCA